ncbi:MAG: T9SS type A sorting domain-containing protein [Saprospiraceae bacterium]
MLNKTDPTSSFTLTPGYLIRSAILIACHLLFYQIHSQTIYGENNYIEYSVGTLPLVISVPHGGNLSPDDIPTRTCNSPTTVTDANTVELGRLIDTAFMNLTGCHPHMIYCHLRRTKIDCNRPIGDGTCGNITAEKAWNEFQDFIIAAQKGAQNHYEEKVFYIDLHGHGHAIQRLELGYLLSDNELERTDAILNSSQYISNSSIKNLVESNVHNLSHAELLRGQNALGTLLGNAGFPAVPSEQDPFPGTNTSYFSGGYNTQMHTSYIPDNPVNGVQLECNFTNVRDTYTNRKRFADSLASVISKYLLIHQNISFADCSTATGTTSDKVFPIRVFPNPASDFIRLILPKDYMKFVVEIKDVLGRTVMKVKNELNINIEKMPKGNYFISIQTDDHFFSTRRLIIE